MPNKNLFSQTSVGIILCTAGEMEVILNEQPYKIIRGSYFLISPLVKKTVISRSDDYQELEIRENVERFHRILHRMSSVLGKLSIPDHPLMQADEATLKLMIEHHDKILQYRKQLSDSTEETGSILYEILLEHAIQGLWLKAIEYYYQHHEHTQNPKRHYSHVTTSFFMLVNQEFREHRSVRYYAESARLSTGYFSHIIKSETGYTPMQLIILVTINNAKLLLSNTTMSIKEIADELGFPEQFTFRKYFKQHTGISPKSFRKQVEAYR